MQTRRLGNSDLHITPIGFGAWAIGGGGWAFGWGTQDDSDSIAAIREAPHCGINWIDTAAVYGLGHSEEIVARALQGVPNRPYVFTKCERVWDENVLRAHHPSPSRRPPWNTANDASQASAFIITSMKIGQRHELVSRRATATVDMHWQASTKNTIRLTAISGE